MDVISESPKDGASFLSSTIIEKSWVLRNGGRNPWSKDTILRFHNVEPASAVAEKNLLDLRIGQISSGDVIRVAVKLHLPDRSGRYTFFWTLRDRKSIYWLTARINVNLESEMEVSAETVINWHGWNVRVQKDRIVFENGTSKGVTIHPNLRIEEKSLAENVPVSSSRSE